MGKEVVLAVLLGASNVWGKHVPSVILCTGFIFLGSFVVILLTFCSRIVRVGAKPVPPSSLTVSHAHTMFLCKMFDVLIVMILTVTILVRMEPVLHV